MKHLGRLATLFLFMSCTTPGDPTSPSFDDASVEQALFTRVSEERAVQRVRQLAAIGPRMGGTESGERAADYLLRQFSAHGLVAEIVEDSPTWAHQEDFWRVTATSQSGESLELERAWPYGFSPASSGELPLRLEPEKESALLLDRMPRRRAADYDWPGIVLIDGYATEGGEYAKIRPIRRSSERPVFGISTSEGTWLRERVEEGVTITWDLQATIAESPPRTVIAKIPAAEQNREGYFLFCAHGDSDAGGPGANDNASGEAIVLEIASAWGTALRAKAAPLPPFEIRFAIWGSEIHSTRDFLDRAKENGDKILGVLNYDQSGFGSTMNALFIEPDDLPANRELVLEIAAVLEEYAGTEGFPERWVTNGSQGGTDSYVFSSDRSFRENLIPSVTLYASAWDRLGELERTDGMPGESWNDGDEVRIDYDVYYHSAGDTPENTTDKEPFNMGWSARVGLVACWRWLARQ